MGRCHIKEAEMGPGDFFQGPVQLHLGVKTGVQIFHHRRDEALFVNVTKGGNHRRHILGVIAVLPPGFFILGLLFKVIGKKYMVCLVKEMGHMAMYGSHRGTELCRCNGTSPADR